MTAVVLLVVVLTTVHYNKAEDSSGVAAELPGAFSEQVYEIFQEGIYGENVKKISIIPESATSGSKPDPSKFVVTKDVNEALAAARKAEEYGLIKLDELAFNAETKLAAGGEIQYYLDESIFVLCWKEYGHHTRYNFCEIGVAHASQLRRYITDNKYGSSKRLTTSTMAKDANAVVAISGDFYAYRNNGVVVYQSNICRVRCDESLKLHHCYINNEGDLIVTRENLSESQEKLQAFVDENKIRFSIAFGPILIENYEIQDNTYYRLGEIHGEYSRAALGQVGDLHYILCTADGGVDGLDGVPVIKVAEKMLEKGCKTAYALDGGQTATIIFNNKVYNRVGYGSERLISDIIYFATTVEAE